MSKKYVIGLKVKDSNCGEYLEIADCQNEKPVLDSEELHAFNDLASKEAIITGIGKCKPTSDAQVWNIGFEYNFSFGRVVTELWKKYDYFKRTTYGVPDLHVKLRAASEPRKIRYGIEFSELFIKEITKTETILTIAK